MFAITTTHNNYLAACREGRKVHIRLGSPRRQNCNGIGICRMEMAEDELNNECICWVSALLRIDGPTGRLLLHMDNLTLHELTRKRQFAADLFDMEVPFAVPLRIAEELGLPVENHAIAPGRYPILDDGEFTTLSLRLLKRKIVSFPGLRVAA